MLDVARVCYEKPLSPTHNTSGEANRLIAVCCITFSLLRDANFKKNIIVWIVFTQKCLFRFQ